jgi:hypothetical protein
MLIRYVGPYDAVEIDGVPGSVKRGETVDVPAAVAGKAADPRLEAAHLEHAAAVAAIDHVGAMRLRDEILTLDAGSGLLAQSANFEAVKAAKKGDPS